MTGGFVPKVACQGFLVERLQCSVCVIRRGRKKQPRIKLGTAGYSVIDKQYKSVYAGTYTDDVRAT